MTPTKVYSVWSEGTGDWMKGYKPKFISNHLDSKIATRVAYLNSGYVEEQTEVLSPEYLKSLQAQDNDLREANRRVSNSVRSMLRDGG